MVAITNTGEVQYDRVQRVIQERILSGELKPGQRLVRRVLAKELGVSPIPVIEALHRLEVEGLVEHEPSVGARVRPMTREQILDDLVLREAIESQIMRQLVGRLGPTTLAELRVQAAMVDAAMQGGRVDDEQGMVRHAAFHLELARLTGRPVLLAELRKIWTRRTMQMTWATATVTITTPPDWHAQLIDALESQDVQKADAAARHHVRRTPLEQDTVVRGIADALAHIPGGV